MNWRLFIAFRYLTGSHRLKFISLVGIISVLGVAIGVGALIIVISVMTGFDEDLKNKIIGTYSHLEVVSEYGVRPTGELAEKILSTPHVKAAAPFINGQALIRFNDKVTGVIVKGIDPQKETAVGMLGGYIKEGSLEMGADGIIIGQEMAKRLGAKLGDKISLVSPAFVEGKKFTVRATFSSGWYEYDSNLAYINIPKAQEFFTCREDLVSGMAVRLDDALRVEEVKAVLQKKLGFPYSVRSWMDSNRNFLEALKLEKTVMFIILTLIVMVACFNIASSLIMTVLEKTKDIGILKAVGASNFDVMLIFASLGAITGIVGTAAGTALGVGMCWCLKTYKFITLPKDIYYIDKLPVKVEAVDIAIIVTSAIVITLVSTIYPARQAARLDPVEALRYE